MKNWKLPNLKLPNRNLVAMAKTIYSVHPSVAYWRSIIERMPVTTGKSLDQWVALLKKQALPDAKAQKEWLKTTHKLGGTTTSMIADALKGVKPADTDPDAYLVAAAEYVEGMYGGPKSGLRPIHDALIAMALKLHKEVKVCPCQTIVPLYREHVIAQIKPSTKTRIDFGLALKGVTGKIPDRLKDTGGLAKGDRITHAIALSSVDEVDDEVRFWFEKAWELDVVAPGKAKK